jgi:MFS family permease
VFLLPVEASFQASRSQMLLTYSIYHLVYGLAAPFAGQLVDRAGPRRAYGLGLAALGCGYVLAGQAQSLPLYYLAVGVMGGLGAACLGMVVASSIMSRWFEQRLGTVMSLPYAALGAGMLFIPPLTQLLLERYSWQQASVILGIGVLALLPGLFLLPLKRIGEGSPAWQASRSSATPGAVDWTLRDALETRAFWGLAGAYFATSVASFAVSPQMVAYLIEQGHDRLLAASAFGLTGACSAIGIVAMGSISDTIGRRRAALISYVLSITGVLALLLVSVLNAFWPVWLYVLFFGLMQGVRGPIILAMVATAFRGGSVGSIFGALTLAPGIGAAVGSWASGYLHDVTDGYTASFMLGIAGSCVGMALFWLLPSLADTDKAIAEDLPPPRVNSGP